MKRSSIAIFLFVSIAVLGNAQSSSNRLEHKLKVDLTTNKSAFLQGEPVFFNIRLSNVGSDDIDLDPEDIFRSFHVEVRMPDGNVTELDLRSERIISSSRPVAMPGTKVQISKDFQSVRTVVPPIVEKISEQSGTYQLRLGLKGLGEIGDLKSNIVEVEIINAKGSDKEAYDFMTKNKMDLWYGTLGFKDDETVFAEFINTYGSGSYGEYAKYFLGRYLVNSKKDAEKARKLLSELKNSSNAEISKGASNLLDAKNSGTQTQ